MSDPSGTRVAPIRRPAVAGSFYPAAADELTRIVDRQLAGARPPEAAVTASAPGLAGILVPHAGLVYSGSVAAAAWQLAASVPFGSPAAEPAAATPTDTDGTRPSGPATVVLLGTNHSAGWLTGIGAWDAGSWRTPLGDCEVDAELAVEIVALGPPFDVDREAHLAEHSIEVQLPYVLTAMPGARIVPLAVAAGTGVRAVAAGEALGALLSRWRARGRGVGLAISTDMAHYPPAAIAERVTDELAPFILGLEPRALAVLEADVTRSGLPGMACGMCGIQPTVVGLAALRAMGVEGGVRLAAATSADVGGPSDWTVGYLAAAFPG